MSDQLRFGDVPARPPRGPLVAPDGELIVSYGGGVNSVALLLALHDAGIRPRAITMADPGSERAGTMTFRDGPMREWCVRVGFPEIIVLERRLVGIGRARTWRLETLYDECVRIESLPSVAYGWKKCSAKYKAEPQRWWCEVQPWVQEAWAAGRKIVKAIGYDLDEKRRVDASANVEWKPANESTRFASWYPLYELGLDRDGCLDLIAHHGFVAPPKSACTYCPNNTIDEWKQLRRDEPEAFAKALAMSEGARLTAEDSTGLMRCNPRGARQLHVWNAGGYPDLPPDDPEGLAEDMPCECAT